MLKLPKTVGVSGGLASIAFLTLLSAHGCVIVSKSEIDIF
jgi:hypothetical protein